MFKQFESMQQQAQEVKEVKPKTKENTSKKFTKTDLANIEQDKVVVKSSVENVCFKSPKTHITYSWLTKGDVELMSIGEILAMESKSLKYLHTPWLIVDDDRVIEALGLKETYNLVKKVEDVSELVKLSKEELEKVFNSLPKQYQNNFRNEIYKKVKERELNNLTTIDNLSDILHIDLRGLKK
jgi:hypothetical protein